MTISWWEFVCWLRHLNPADSAYARIRAHEAAEEAKPDDERTVGGKSDALPIEELNRWLEWDDDMEGGELPSLSS